MKCLHFIYGSFYLLIDAEKCSQLDLFMIIYGIVRDLQYLHDDSPKRIVHRDLNPQNFLLDTEFKPKISDFEHGKNFVNYQGRIQRGAGGLGPPTVGTPWK